MEQIFEIAGFILDSFSHIWPYLIITIPLAVAVKLSGAARYINKAFSKSPLISIFLATLVGAFSPFCSCGVIPVIASLLIGGVPLGPVMSFWIASPSMDPEIFFLSTATIGWELSVWRLAATFVISLLSGYLTHMAFQHGLLDTDILRKSQISLVKRPMKQVASEFLNQFGKEKAHVQLLHITPGKNDPGISCCISVEESACQMESCNTSGISFQKRLINETWKALFMIAKFMSLAFLVNALIRFYVPQELVLNLLGGNSAFSVVMAALIGVPVYASNITALPLISRLLASGMNQGAALAFLISGPVTTLPAMVAVYGIVKKKIFVMYVSFALTGAVLFGLLINFFS